MLRVATYFNGLRAGASNTFQWTNRQNKYIKNCLKVKKLLFHWTIELKSYFWMNG